MMGYFSNACRYCNNDQPECTCKCHFPSIYDLESHEPITCDSEEYD